MKVVIVHGFNPRDKDRLNSENYVPQNVKNWIPWIKEKLGEKGIECITPLMPESWTPDYNKWKQEFEKIPIDEESILVGTSAGGAFLIRWLGEIGKKVKKLILVAPAKFSEGRVYNSFYDFEISEEITNNTRKIIIFESSNDSENIIKAGKIYSEKLRVKPIILEGKGHFTERGMGTNEFPELLEEIMKE